jgi:hydroxyethylthiazole kinase
MSDALRAMREAGPLVHCITNYVAMNISANVLLAAGASPAMIHTSEETPDFAKIVGSLTVNIGTLSPHWVEGMRGAIKAAIAAKVPWVFDPVAHFATPYRAGVVQEVLAMAPTILRGNASEILALSGQSSTAKGVDATDPVAVAEASAMRLANDLGSVVAISGEQDFVTDGMRVARVSGGSAMMPQITALGCSLTCLMGGFVAVAPPLVAAVAASELFAEAGEIADRSANGPGTFQPLFLDALANITPEELANSGRVQWQ